MRQLIIGSGKNQLSMETCEVVFVIYGTGSSARSAVWIKITFLQLQSITKQSNQTLLIYSLHLNVVVNVLWKMITLFNDITFRLPKWVLSIYLFFQYPILLFVAFA